MTLARRGLLGGVGLVAACGGRAPPVSESLPPIGYGHLTPLPLDVGAIVVASAEPPLAPGDFGQRLQPSPVEAVRIMARDRLVAVGTQGEGRFAITRASLTRGAGLVCAVGCRLEIVGAEEARLGFVEAEARAAASGSEASRADAAELLLRRAMDDLNVEFEYQIRRNLRTWLVAVPPGGSTGAVPAPLPGSVAREELPRS